MLKSGELVITAKDIIAQIIELRDEVRMLKGELTSRAQSTFKVALPEKFLGQQNKLQAYLAQMEMFLHFNKKALLYQADQVIAAATYLKDKAFNWFKPKLKDFLERGKDMKKDTIRIFSNY